MESIMQIHLINRFNRRFAARQTEGTVRRIANSLAALVAVLATGILASSPASAQTNLTFQQNVSAYTGVLDTRIISSSASPLNTEATSNIDGGGTTFMDPSWAQGLFSFSGLFGSSGSQIPLNATITSATLTITTDNAGNSQSSNSFGIYRLNSGFTAGTTWGNSFGGDGIQVGIETAAADDTKVGGPQLGTVAFNVLGSMNFWKSQPDANAANFGWAVSAIAGTDGWIVRMSENASASSRPLLSVTYLIPQNLTWNAANATGTWDSGNGANQVWINDTTTLAASFNNTDNVFFSQNPASQVDITVAGVSPSTMTVSHTSGTYAFSGGSITSLLTKTGNGTMVLNASNTFSSANLSGGTVEVNAADAFGTAGSVTLNGGVTLHPTLTTFNDPALGFAFNTTSTIQVDTGNSYQIYGITSGNGTLTKTGAGTLEFRGTSGFNGQIDVQGGTVLLANPSGVGGDLNVTQIAVQNGATFQFGGTSPTTEENPDLPDATFITVNAGGTTTFTVGEQYGGITLNGGTFNNNLVNTAQSSSWVNAAPSTLMSGAMNGTANLFIGAAHTVNKTTSGMVTVTALPIVISGTLNLEQGVFSTDAPLTGNGTLNIGSATDNGILQLRAVAPTAYTKAFNIGDVGATIDVSEASGDITWSGTVSGSGGTLTKAGPGQLTLTGLNTTTGPVRVAEGKLNVGGINNGGQAGPLGASSSSAANLVLDGGTLRYTGASANSNRGFTVGNSGGTFEVVNAGTKVTLTGTSTGSGNFTKTGPGILVLAGTNQYGGTTSVAEGNLAVAPFAATGGFSVANGATLTALVPTLSSSLSMPTLTMGSVGSAINFEMQTAGVPTSSLLNVTNSDGINLNSATQTLNVLTSAPLAVGTYKLIDYTGAPVTSGFALGTVGGRAVSNLVYNTTDTRIDLQVISSDTIKWKGDLSSDWDVGSAANVGGTNNWILNSNSSATNFIAGDIVTFDDSASSFNLNLTTAVNPGLVTVNNSTNAYAFQGSGKITGAGSLTKTGTGALTIETNNDYTGNTTISTGTLQVGNGGTTGTIGTGALANDGSLVINRSDNVALSVPVTGTGGLTKLGTNTLTISGNYGSTGGITVSGGTVELAAAQPMSIAGNIDGAGAITKTGDSTLTLMGANTHAAGTNITAGTVIAANTTGSATGTGTTMLSSGTTLQIGNGATAGSVGGTVDSGPSGSSGNIVIDRSDDFTIPANIAGGGPIVKNGGGKASLTGNLSYSGATTISAGTLAVSPASDFTYAATTSVDANTLEINSASNVRFNNPVTGTGNIVKNGTGNFILNGDSTFTGTVTVNQGAVILQDDQLTTGFAGDINAEVIVVNSGGRFQFGSGQSISGENPDLPGNTYITLNAGGQIDWFIGEDFGGMHIKGGTLNLNGNNNYTSTNFHNIWESGTISTMNATARSIGNIGVIVKTTNGTITVNNVNLNNTGGLNIQDGTLSTNAGITDTGTLTFGANGVGATAGTLLLTNSAAGAISSTKPVTINAGGGVINIAAAGKIYNYNGNVSGTGNFTKEGPGTLQLGNTSNSYVGATMVNAGTMRVNGTHNGGGAYTVANGATLGGTGTIGSTVNVNTGGILSPGAATSVGTLTTASTILGGTLQVEYSGTASTIDQLTVTGLLNLTGAAVDFDNLTVGTPLSGAGPFVFASYNTLTGTFGSSVVDLPAGYSIDYNYLGNKQIALVAGPVLQAGDFDADGDVDGADFIAWQTHFPTPSGAPRANGDNDGDTDVDGADFAAWQSNFPHAPGPGSSPVPEPAGLSLALVACLGGLKLFHARRKKK